MVSKTMSFMVVLLMVSPLLMLGGVIPQGSTISTQRNSIQSNAAIAETDLGRVIWEDNVIPNSGLEDWNNPYSPTDLYTVRTIEERVWTETTTVFEGTHSVGIHGRAIEPSHYADVRLTQSAWIYWDNPLNTTLDFEYYIDEIGNPIDSDYYLMRVRMSNRYMYYFIGCEQTGVVNGSYAYFFIDSATKVWNHLHQNLTSDYIEVFASQPTQFQVIEWYVRSYTNTYTRVFMDDVNLVNGTTVKIGGSINNGNFEGGPGWYYQSATDPADISQSSVSHEGNWSMNMTTITTIADSYAYASVQPRKLLTTSNQGELSFWWRIDDWVNPTTSTYARVLVSASNATHDFGIYYYLGVGGSGQLPMLISSEDMKFAVTGFNVTNAWNFFDRNIWEDFNSGHSSENLWIDEIEFQVRNYEDNSRLSVLIDDIEFRTSMLNDMDYEHQNEVGTEILSWGSSYGSDQITVTDFACNGYKAANLTLYDGESFDDDQTIGRIPIDNNTELILDFNVYIDSFNQTSNDFVLFEIEFEGTSFAYVIANSTNHFESSLGEGDGSFILLQDTIITGEWLNFQLDIIHDYETIFGNLGTDTLRYLYLTAETDTGSKLKVFFDDVYIYFDPAPDVSNVQHRLTIAPGGGPATAVFNATVVDATLESVVLNFRVNNGTWQYASMSHITTSTYSVNITNLVGDLVVEYSITATDAFDKTVTALNGTDYYTFSVSTGTLPGPDNLGPVLVVIAILAIGIVALLYIFFYKKK